MSVGARRRRTNRTEVLNPNLTPLLDVVLQLITFFMMLVHFGAKIEGASESIRLPVLPAALPGSDLALDRLVASINAEGRLMIGDRVFDQDQADRWWQEQSELRLRGMASLGDRRPQLKTFVVLRADKQATYGAVRQTLTSAQRHGFVHFSLIVIRSDAS